MPHRSKETHSKNKIRHKKKLNKRNQSRVESKTSFDRTSDERPSLPYVQSSSHMGGWKFNFSEFLRLFMNVMVIQGVYAAPWSRSGSTLSFSRNFPKASYGSSLYNFNNTLSSPAHHMLRGSGMTAENMLFTAPTTEVDLKKIDTERLASSVEKELGIIYRSKKAIQSFLDNLKTEEFSDALHLRGRNLQATGCTLSIPAISSSFNENAAFITISVPYTTSCNFWGNVGTQANMGFTLVLSPTTSGQLNDLGSQTGLVISISSTIAASCISEGAFGGKTNLLCTGSGSFSFKYLPAAYYYNIASVSISGSISSTSSSGTSTGAAGGVVVLNGVVDSSIHLTAPFGTLSQSIANTGGATILPLPTGAFNNFNQVPVTYTMTPSVAWAQINANTGTLTLNPVVGNQGTQTFTIRITNTGNAADTASVQWPIVVPNYVPQAGSFLINPLLMGTSLSVTIPELTLFSDANGIADLCPTGTLPCRVTLVTSSSSAWMSFNPTTGALTGTPPAAGTYIAELLVTDTVGATATTPLTVVVNPSLSFSDTAVSQITQGQTTSITGFVVGTPSTTTTVTLSMSQNFGSLKVNPSFSGLTVTPSSGQSSSSGQMQISGPPAAVNSCLASLQMLPTITNRSPVTITANVVDGLGQIASASQVLSVTPVNHPFTTTSISVTGSITTPAQPTLLTVTSANIGNVDSVLWVITSVQIANSGGTIVASNTNLNGWTITGLNGIPTNQQAQAIITPPAGSQSSYTVSLGIQAVDSLGNVISGMPVLTLNSTLSVSSAAISVPSVALSNLGVGTATTFTLPRPVFSGDTVTDQITNLPAGWNYNSATCVLTAIGATPGVTNLLRQVCYTHDSSQCATQTYTTVVVSTLSVTNLNTNSTQIIQGQATSLSLFSASTPSSLTATLNVDPTRAQLQVNTTLSGVSVSSPAAGELVIFGTTSAAVDNALRSLVITPISRLPVTLTADFVDGLGQIYPTQSRTFSVTPVTHQATAGISLQSLSTIPTQATQLTITEQNINDPDSDIWKVSSVWVVSNNRTTLANTTAGLNGWSIGGVNQAPSNQIQIPITPPANSQNPSDTVFVTLQFCDALNNPIPGKTLTLSAGLSVTTSLIQVPALIMPQLGVNQTATVTLPAASSVGVSLTDRITNAPAGWSYNSVTRLLTMQGGSPGPVTLTRLVCATDDPTQCVTQTYTVTVVPTIVIDGVMNAQLEFRGRSFTLTYPSASSPVGYNISISLQDTSGAPAPAWLQPNPITGIATGIVPADALSTYNLVPVYTDEKGNQQRLSPFTLSTAVALTVQISNSAQALFQENQAGASLPPIIVSSPGVQNVTATVIVPSIVGVPLINAALITSTGITPIVNLNAATGNYEYTVSGTQAQVNAHLANIGLTLGQNYFGNSQIQVLVNNGVDPQASSVLTVNIVHVDQPPYLANPVVVPVHTEGDSFFIPVPTTTWGDPDLNQNVGESLTQYDNTTDIGSYVTWVPGQLGYSIVSVPQGIHTLRSCVRDTGGLIACTNITYQVNPNPSNSLYQSFWAANQQYFQYAGYALGASPIAYKIYTILKFLIAGYVQDRRSKKKLEATQRFRNTLKREYPATAIDAFKIEVEKSRSRSAGEGAEVIEGETGFSGQIIEFSKRNIKMGDLRDLSNKIMAIVSADGLKEQKEEAEKLIAQFDLWTAKAALNDPPHDDLPRALELELLEMQHKVGELIESALIDKDYDDETVLLARFNLSLLEFLFFLKATQARPIKVDRQIEMLNQLLASPGVRDQWYLKYLKRMAGFAFFCCAKRFSKTYQVKDEVKLPLKTAIALITRFPNTDSLWQKVGRLTKWVTPGGTKFVPPAILWEDQVERLRIMALFARRDRVVLMNIIRDYLNTPDNNPHLLIVYQMTMAALAEEAAKEAEKAALSLGADASLQDRRALKRLAEAASIRALIEKTAEIRQKTFFVIHASNKPYLQQIIAEHGESNDLEMLMVYNTCLKNIAEKSVSRECRLEATEALRRKGALSSGYLPSSTVLCVQRASCCQPRQGRKVGKSSRLFATVPSARGDAPTLQANPLSGEVPEAAVTPRSRPVSVRLSTYSAGSAASSHSLRNTAPGGRRKSYAQLSHLVGNPMAAPSKAVSEEGLSPVTAVVILGLSTPSRESVSSTDSLDDGAASTGSTDSSASSGEGRREVLQHVRAHAKVRPLTGVGRDSADSAIASSPTALFYRSPIGKAANKDRTSRSSMTPSSGAAVIRRGSRGAPVSSGAGVGLAGAGRPARRSGRVTLVPAPSAAAREETTRQMVGASV